MKIYETVLPRDEDFNFLKITFFPNNDEKDNELFNPNYKDNVSIYLEIEAITTRFDYQDFEVDSDIIYTSYKVSEKDRKIIFKLLNNSTFAD